jgi:hypothetical protein
MLAIDPAMQFGTVTIYPSRIPAAAISGCVLGGDSVGSVAEGYGITEDEVRLCCWWRVMEADRGRRTKENRLVLDQWLAWAIKVQPGLGGWEGHETTDPPEIARG